MSTVSYKCINCGGPLKYNPANLKFSCEYCQSDFTEEELQAHFGKLDETLNDAANEEHIPEPQDTNGDGVIDENDFNENTVVYQCPSCGAEVITDATTAATSCVYCHSPVVLTGRLAGNMKPKKVIPFKISSDKAKERFREICKKKWFLPSSFLSETQLENMKGVYYPYWMVDSLKDGEMYATGKKVRTWTQGDYRYTETKIYKIIRAGKIDFKNYPKEALNTENADLLKYVNPYDDTAFKNFSMSYLSGFQAEKRNLEREDLQAVVDRDLVDYSQKIYKDTIHGYDSITVDHIHLDTLEESWDYALLPVWVMTYKYKDKNLLYAANGQTGKMYGSLPCSVGKLFVLGGIVAVLVFLAIFLGGYFLL